jgi:exonuclease III
MVSSTAVQAELKTVSDSVEDITNTISTSNASTPTEIDNCYKKFLKYYKLPQIQEPVTLIKFIQHLHQNSFFNPIKISINFTKTETHIYLNNIEPTLPNHTILDPSLYKTQGHLPLLTISKWKIPDINSISFTKSDQLSNPTTLIPPLNTVPIITAEHISSSAKIDLTNTNELEVSNNIKSIKIHSLNVNGLLDNYKQLSLIDYISENQIDIFGISETHLSTKEAKFSTLSKKLTNYKSFWTPSNARQSGVGILIHKSLAKHIGKIQTYKNFLIEIDIFLKNLHVKLIQIYFPTQEKKQLRKDILSYLTPILNKTNYKIILMGDLNGVPNPKLDRIPQKNSNTPEHSLLKLLKSLQFYDTYRLFYPSTSMFSYIHNNSHSRIDQIWTNIHITILDYADILPNPFTSSDHSIVLLEFTINLPKINTHLLQTRTIYQ